MSVTEAIAHICAYVSKPPANEAATRMRVIDKVLQHLGYALDEIEPENDTAAGPKPDYILLPEDPAHTWFLESRAWSQELSEGDDLARSLAYACSEGKRWVVLTNGREWRLYDAAREETRTFPRWLVSASIENTAELERLLRALSKEVVLTGELESYVNQVCLSAILTDQLQDVESALIQAVCQTLQSAYHLSALQATDIAYYFRQLYAPTLPLGDENLTSERASLPLPPATQPTTQPELSLPLPAAKTGAVGRSVSSPARSLAALLKQIQKDSKTGWQAVANKKPCRLTFPDGSSVGIKSWADMEEELVRWISKAEKLPSLPFCGRGSGNQYLLNDAPYHALPGVRMQSFREVKLGDRSVFVSTHRSASDQVRVLHALCQAASVQPSAVLIDFR